MEHDIASPFLRLIGRRPERSGRPSEERTNSRRHDFRLHFLRGVTLYHLRRYDAAIRDFGVALRLDWRDERAVRWIDRAERARHSRLGVQARFGTSAPSCRRVPPRTFHSIELP